MKAKRGRSTKERPSRKELKRLYQREEMSIREIAGILEVSKDLVYRALREYKIERRPGMKKSRLKRFDLGHLKKGVQSSGYRETARKLDINEWTLRAYLKGK